MYVCFIHTHTRSKSHMFQVYGVRRCSNCHSPGAARVDTGPLLAFPRVSAYITAHVSHPCSLCHAQVSWWSFTLGATLSARSYLEIEVSVVHLFILRKGKNRKTDFCSLMVIESLVCNRLTNMCTLQTKCPVPPVLMWHYLLPNLLFFCQQ